MSLWTDVLRRADAKTPNAAREDETLTDMRARWHRSYRTRLHFTDIAMLFTAAIAGSFIRFGIEPSQTTTNGPVSVTYGTFGLFIAAGWLIALEIYRTDDARIVGDGVEEYRRIIRASVTYFGIFAIISVAFKIDASRGFMAITFPLGIGLLLLGRKFWRVRLAKSRARGAMMSNALVIGGIRSAEEITRWFKRERQSGYRVTGVWVPDRETDADRWLQVPDNFVPIMGTERTLSRALAVSEAEVVIVTDTEHLGQKGLKELTWQLESMDVDLMIAPNLVDVSGSRLQLNAIAKVPFLHVQKPTYAEAAAWPKTVFDKVGAGLILLAASPLFIGLALAVKLSSPGGVFYRQERIGIDGKPFDMLKFRSMRTGSDAQLKELLEKSGSGLGPLAKIDNDPRLTPIGSFIRRFSLDELPQLVNVLNGTMSLVGPRPQRQFEVDLYDHIAHRRLRVRPGMTGLWQVSGRSDLTWEDAIRLDTFYVENWSLTGDMSILWRTFRAVVRSEGAY